MAAAAHRWPPPPLAPLATTRPGLSKATEERHTDGVDCARFFREWCEEHGLSVRDLNAMTTIAVSLCGKKLAGEVDVGLRDLKRFPPRYRREFLLAFDAWCDVEERRARTARNHHG